MKTKVLIALVIIYIIFSSACTCCKHCCKQAEKLREELECKEKELQELYYLKRIY